MELVYPVRLFFTESCHPFEEGIHHVPIQKSRLLSPILIQICWPMLHAMLYRYFGEKTVHMNKCVLNAVHASITNRTLLETKVVSVAE